MKILQHCWWGCKLIQNFGKQSQVEEALMPPLMYSSRYSGHSKELEITYLSQMSLCLHLSLLQ